MRLAAAVASLVALGVGVSMASASPLPGTSCAIFPADNPWKVPVDKLPVEADSATIINSIGATKGLHADFGAGLWQGQPIGSGSRCRRRAARTSIPRGTTRARAPIRRCRRWASAYG